MNPDMNKDLVLREYLAVERTKLAAETTFLAYIRTGLYFLVAGSTLGKFVETTFVDIISVPLVVIGLLTMVGGYFRYRKVKKEIDLSKQNIGNSTEAFIKHARQI